MERKLPQFGTVKKCNMKVLCQRYMGMIARCNSGCGALIGYSPEDVSANQCIKCPQCGMVLWVPFNPNYDGVIKEDSEEKKDETVV